MSNSKTVSISLAIAFFAIITGAAIIGKLPMIVAVAYALLSIVTFSVYAIDKSAAKRNAWRTPESTLHLLALAGGWPGALIAQQTLRHKSSKQSFRLVFWITVLVNLGIFIWLFSAAEELFLNTQSI